MGFPFVFFAFFVARSLRFHKPAILNILPEAGKVPGEEDEVHFIHDGLGKRRSSVIARKESSTDEAIWASAGCFESRRERGSKCLPVLQIASSLEDSLFAMTTTADANPAMEREWYRYDAGWNVVGQYADDPAGFWDIGGLESTAVWHGMTPLAEVTGSTPNGAYRHATHDHLGSTRSLFDASKKAVGAIEYTPYGLPLVTAGVTPEYTFTGKPYDAETGMYHFPFRQYSPTTGRWLTLDPLGMVDGPNVYGYVGGDPINSHDPDGRSIIGFPSIVCDWARLNVCLAGALQRCQPVIPYVAAACSLCLAAPGPWNPACYVCVGGIAFVGGSIAYCFYAHCDW